MKNERFFFVFTSAVWAVVILIMPVLCTAVEESLKNGFPVFSETWSRTMAFITPRYVIVAVLTGVVINLISKLISIVRR